MTRRKRIKIPILVGSIVGQALQRIALDEQRALSQVCEMFLYEGVEGSKKEGPKFIQRLVAKQKARVKDS